MDTEGSPCETGLRRVPVTHNLLQDSPNIEGGVETLMIKHGDCWAGRAFAAVRGRLGTDSIRIVIPRRISVFVWYVPGRNLQAWR